MRPRILVINPNSNESVTDGLRQSLVDYADDVDIDCCTLSDGPFGIESDDDVAVAAGLVIDRVASANDYDACVIACYSDPGLADCRERFDKPVFGMQQSALEAAAGIGRFGVLALSDESITRHLAYIDRLALGDRLAGATTATVQSCLAIRADGSVDPVIVKIYDLGVADEPTLAALRSMRRREKAGVISFTLGDIHPHDLGTIIDHHGVALRTGHHCAMPVME